MSKWVRCRVSEHKLIHGGYLKSRRFLDCKSSWKTSGIMKFPPLPTSVYILIILLLFCLWLAVSADRIETTRFQIWFVHEYNFHAFYIAENALVKHKNKQKEKSRHLSTCQITVENEKHLSNCPAKAFIIIGVFSEKNLETLQYVRSLQS